MLRIITLGTSAKPSAFLSDGRYPDCHFIPVGTLDEAENMMNREEGGILLIWRDFFNPNRDEISRLLNSAPYPVILWPSDQHLDLLLSHLCVEHPDNPELCSNSEEIIEKTKNLAQENEVFRRRIAVLEGSIRSLISALSQYEPAAEAYTTDEDAWEMIMKNIPTAEINPEEPDIEDNEYSEDEGYEE